MPPKPAPIRLPHCRTNLRTLTSPFSQRSPWGEAESARSAEPGEGSGAELYDLVPHPVASRLGLSPEGRGTRSAVAQSPKRNLELAMGRLHDEGFRSAKEIHDVWAERHLADELVAAEFASAEPIPEPVFSVRLFAA